MAECVPEAEHESRLRVVRFALQTDSSLHNSQSQCCHLLLAIAADAPPPNSSTVLRCGESGVFGVGAHVQVPHPAAASRVGGTRWPKAMDMLVNTINIRHTITLRIVRAD